MMFPKVLAPQHVMCALCKSLMHWPSHPNPCSGKCALAVATLKWTKWTARRCVEKDMRLSEWKLWNVKMCIMCFCSSFEGDTPSVIQSTLRNVHWAHYSGYTSVSSVQCPVPLYCLRFLMQARSSQFICGARLPINRRVWVQPVLSKHSIFAF